MSKIRPQGAFNLVEETGSPSSSNSVASASERCEQETTVPREGALAQTGIQEGLLEEGKQLSLKGRVRVRSKEGPYGQGYGAA